MHSENINNLFILLFSRSTKKIHCFLSKISLDKICTENCIKIIQIHQNMHLKLLLENNKKFFLLLLSFQHGAAQDALKTARPSCPRAHRPHPGRNLGLGRQSAAHPRARLGRRWPEDPWLLVLIGRSRAVFGRIKTNAARGA